MRKTIIITCLILSGILILDSFNAGQIFILFLFAGIIPGTNIALSPSVMMEIFALLFGLVLGRLCSKALQPIFLRLPALKRA